ncbi:MAG TPA: hypothetical protein VHD87_18030 [Acidimicrobiales bacterium]|nr:hypothetical protein [Acidimicrobiales bacterium]
MSNKMFTLIDLLDWLEALLDHRDEHRGEWYMLFATDERYVELNITADEVWAGAVTNHNLSKEQWLSEVESIKMGLYGWALEAIDTPEPKYVRRWSSGAPTSLIASKILQVFTSIYLPKDADTVEVVRGTFAEGNVGWDSLL